jgi:hypothetical protein
MHVFRPEPQTACDPAIYLATDGLPAELWRGVEIALAGFVPGERLFFEGGEADWEGWCTGTFASEMAPRLIAAREAGDQGVRDWAEIDAAFAAAMGNRPGAERSLRAGRALADIHVGARHFQMLDRLRRTLENDPQAGHAAMVVAFLSAQFNVATTASLVACLFLEWRAAFPELPERAFEPMTPKLGNWLPAWLRSRTFPALQSPPAG